MNGSLRFTGTITENHQVDIFSYSGIDFKYPVQFVVAYLAPHGSITASYGVEIVSIR